MCMYQDSWLDYLQSLNTVVDKGWVRKGLDLVCVIQLSFVVLLRGWEYPELSSTQNVFTLYLGLLSAVLQVTE